MGAIRKKILFTLLAVPILYANPFAPAFFHTVVHAANPAHAHIHTHKDVTHSHATHEHDASHHAVDSDNRLLGLAPSHDGLITHDFTFLMVEIEWVADQSFGSHDVATFFLGQGPPGLSQFSIAFPSHPLRGPPAFLV
jgi:hypothetical protein